MRHRHFLERFVSFGLLFYEAVPLPFVRVVPLRIILFLIRCYWSIFGIR